MREQEIVVICRAPNDSGVGVPYAYLSIRFHAILIFSIRTYFSLIFSIFFLFMFFSLPMLTQVAMKLVKSTTHQVSAGPTTSVRPLHRDSV